MKLYLLIAWLILFPGTSMAIFIPIARTQVENKPYLFRVFCFLLFWPIGLVVSANKISACVSWWRKSIQNGEFKYWQLLLAILLGPICMYGLLDGLGELGGLWISVVVLLASWGNLIMLYQIVKYAGFV